MVRNGKGANDRATYFRNDAADALTHYLVIRVPTRESKVFLVEKGTYKGKPLSVRDIQKQMELENTGLSQQQTKKDGQAET
jgi:site-specific recombinase XerC